MYGLVAQWVELWREVPGEQVRTLSSPLAVLDSDGIGP